MPQYIQYIFKRYLDHSCLLMIYSKILRNLSRSLLPFGRIEKHLKILSTNYLTPDRALLAATEREAGKNISNWSESVFCKA